MQTPNYYSHPKKKKRKLVFLPLLNTFLRPWNTPLSTPTPSNPPSRRFKDYRHRRVKRKHGLKLRHDFLPTSFPFPNINARYITLKLNSLFPPPWNDRKKETREEEEGRKHACSPSGYAAHRRRDCVLIARLESESLWRGGRTKWGVKPTVS